MVCMYKIIRNKTSNQFILHFPRTRRGVYKTYTIDTEKTGIILQYITMYIFTDKYSIHVPYGNTSNISDQVNARVRHG